MGNFSVKITEHLSHKKSPTFSYEIVPPPRGRSLKDIIAVVEQLAPLNPPWIDVTAHSSNVQFTENADGLIKRRSLRKRPGTIGICGVIQNRFKIDTVAHLLCLGFSREETEDALIELQYLGIHNVLALRGDAPNYPKKLRDGCTANAFAIDLIEQIQGLKTGQYLDELDESQPLDFCIGVAGYPEKHFEAPHLKADIERLKAKVAAGAEYIVTQIFYDNRSYFDFVEKCRAAGISVPIIPGLKILKSEAQLRSISKSFYIDIPEALTEEITASPQHALEIGKRWTERQAMELLEAGVPNIHLFVLNDVQAVADVVRKLQR